MFISKVIKIIKKMKNIIFENTFYEINLLMFITYFASYFLYGHIINKTKFPKDKRYFLVSRIISCQHAFLSSYGSYLYLNNYIDYKEWNTRYVMISKMYLLYDLFIVILNFNKNDFIHHIVFYIGIVNNSVAVSTYAARSLYAELSNFNLNFGWFLINIGKDKTILFRINALLLLIVFFIFRVLNYAYITFDIFWNLGFQYINFVIPALWSLNIFWFKLLLGKAMKLYKDEKTN